MAVIGVVSAKGSPGATVSALALSWVWPQVCRRRAVLVDADPAGSGLAAGYLRGSVPSQRGLLSLAAEILRASRATTPGPAWVDLLQDNAVALDDDGSRLVLLGIDSPAQAQQVGLAWPALTELLLGLSGVPGWADTDVLVDVGRAGTTGEPTSVLSRADAVVVVARSSLASVAAARELVRRLVEIRQDRPGTGSGPAVDRRSGEPRSTGGIGCLLVGEAAPYRREEIASAIAVPVVAVLGMDPAAAAVFSDGQPAGWRFHRSVLLRTATAAVEPVRSLLEATPRQPDAPEPETARATSAGRPGQVPGSGSRVGAGPVTEPTGDGSGANG